MVPIVVGSHERMAVPTQSIWLNWKEGKLPKKKCGKEGITVIVMTVNIIQDYNSD